jgi:hypothetical protein
MDSDSTMTMAVPAQAAFLPASIRRRRVIGAIVALGAAVVLGVAAWLTPAGEGLGTHRQMGLPECGWIMILDLPCPTCGMTTAFAFAAEGRLGAAFASQPLGALLAVAVAVSLLVGSFVALTGSRVGAMFGRLWRPRSGWLIAGLIVAAWLFKVVVYTGILS